MQPRYRIEQDEDSHWYLIPAEKKQEWYDWAASFSEEVPEWAKPIDGPHMLTFTDPITE